MADVDFDPAELAKSIDRVASAITPIGIGNGQDATGGFVESLTEAMMGVTAALMTIAEKSEPVPAEELTYHTIHTLPVDQLLDGLEQAICMGIRHGLFGHQADDDADVREIRAEVEANVNNHNGDLD